MEFAKMKQDLWQHLPAELVIDILSRLPIGSIFRYKCVCKSWLDLFESREFCRSHLRNSKSIPGVAFLENCSELCHFYKFVDEHEHDEPRSPERHLSIALKLSLPAYLENVNILGSSVNGLLLLRMWYNNYFICNPLTCDYIKLPSSSHYVHMHEIGFGVSKMSGEYKVVTVSSGMCEVYTLGMGSWRSVTPATYHDNHYHVNLDTEATFLNGNLHWLLHDHKNATYSSTIVGISCFDLETELFTIFPPPPACGYGFYSCICTLEERLAFSQSGWGIVVIWFMNEYGDHKSWTRNYSIAIQSRVSSFEGEGVVPIKVLRGGDILIARLRFSRRLCYFNKTNNTVELFNKSSGELGSRTIVSYTPSILSLKTFSADN